MGLFNFKKKNKLPKATIEMHGYKNGVEVPIQFNKEDNQNDLDYGIWYANSYQIIQKIIKPIEDEMVGYAVEAKNAKAIDERKIALEGVIHSFNILKNKCDSLGGNYKTYFSEMWEHLHNSHKADYSYIERYKKELDELTKNYDKLKADEELHAIESENLEKRVIFVLRENAEILQTELYNHFHPIVKKDIQNMLYHMEKSGFIVREKFGKSYIIHKI